MRTSKCGHYCHEEQGALYKPLPGITLLDFWRNRRALIIDMKHCTLHLLNTVVLSAYRFGTAHCHTAKETLTVITI